MADADETDTTTRLTTLVEGAPEEAGSLDELLRAVVDAQAHRYRSEGVIARGGMGAIEGVIDQTLDRRVVRKQIHKELSDARQARMFVREARVTGRLAHPCVVPVHELGVGEGDQLYYTMELVEGRTLEEWVGGLPEGPLERSTLFDLLEVIVRVCDALAYAHRSGVLHLDVKPANVMVGEFGRVYLMDWGIARLVDEPRPAEATPEGTPGFMAPEQARGLPLDARADVFAAGALIYYVLGRQPPFLGSTSIQRLLKACLCEYPPLEEMPAAEGAPPALLRIVHRAMAAAPGDRYASATALRDAIVRFMRGVDAFERVHFDAGQDVVREGEQGGDAYVIESGRCEVHRKIDGVRTRLREIGPGDVFGEMAILSPGPRTASVTALEPTVLSKITAQTLQAELDSMKPWMGALVRTLAQRFRDREQGR